MSVLLSVVLRLVFWVGVLCFIAGIALIGPRRLYELGHEVVPILRDAKVPIAGLLVVLIVSAVGRSALETLSRLVGIPLTGTIYALEGGFVAWLQATFVTPEATIYFSWIYVYGYVFLLVFPFIAYAALPKTTTFKRLIVAYTLNYAIGLLIYTIIFAHGPRNVMPDAVTSLLYTFNPDFQALTSEVNENTNVFPSLHTSLAVTAGVFGYLTRREYPIWAGLSIWLAVSVMISTMYLGIHWLVDVIAGIGLAFGCVYLSYRFIEDEEPADGSDEQPEEATADPGGGHPAVGDGGD
ncbi:phosphatase PAP2 family protein [Halorubrum vacuolatum]|uniref:Membrane-associated phospholipid phosphatase n=1 Tax=Halorubrum vacuolatum TaxID=63740 RepID=A0A238WQ55_HALVU|nr:phosphatase PAP2 family protein [Halorubrum vacuolatum]SNR48521.1 Membrane-associated phospholipid phosphatase [Halorubrum vacuolatum]